MCLWCLHACMKEGNINFQTTELCRSSTTQLYGYLYIYIWILWFPYGVNAAHSNYRTWSGLYGTTRACRQQILLKYFSRTEKISRIQITKIYFKPNDELEIKLNRMTCSIWKLLIFIIVLTERYMLRLRRFGTGADIFIPFLYLYVRVWSIMLWNKLILKWLLAFYLVSWWCRVPGGGTVSASYECGCPTMLLYLCCRWTFACLMRDEWSDHEHSA